MQTKYYSDAVGKYLGGFAGAEPPEGAIEVPFPPDHAGDVWNGSTWVTPISRHNAVIHEKIKALEFRESLPRPLRDLIKKSCAADALLLGMTLEQIYDIAVAQGDAAPESAKAWKKFKDFDDEIQTLKAHRL